MASTLLSQLGPRWLSTPIGIVVIALLLFSGTYIFTKTRYVIGSLMGGEGKGKQPRTLPYWIPFVGNSIAMTTDAIAFYSVAGYVLSCTFTAHYTSFFLGFIQHMFRAKGVYY